MRDRKRETTPACTSTITIHLQFAVLVDTFFRRLIHRIIDFHNSGLVAASVTIIGRGKHSDNASVVLPLVSFHYQLVSSGNEMQAVDVRELLCDILTKGVSGSPRRNTPTASVIY